MNSPLVSVCMPASRRLAFSNEALASTLAQSYDHLEAIIITHDSGGSIRATTAASCDHLPQRTKDMTRAICREVISAWL